MSFRGFQIQILIKILQQDTSNGKQSYIQNVSQFKLFKCNPLITSIIIFIAYMAQKQGQHAHDLFKIDHLPQRSDFQKSDNPTSASNTNQPNNQITTIPLPDSENSFNEKQKTTKQPSHQQDIIKNNPINKADLKSDQTHNSQKQKLESIQTNDKIGQIKNQTPENQKSQKKQQNTPLEGMQHQISNSSKKSDLSQKVKLEFGASAAKKESVHQQKLQSKNDDVLQLYYWPIRGLAQRVRLLLHYLGLKYQNKYFKDQKEWSEAKQKVKCPIIDLPYLKDGDTIVVQTEAIMIHVILKANKQELLGRNNKQKVDIAQIRGLFGTLHSEYIMLVYGDFDEKKQSFIANAKGYLKCLSQFMGDKDYICGQITYVDFLLAQFFNILDQLDTQIMEEFPRLKDLGNRIWNQSSVRDYVKSQEFKKTPLNSSHAKWGNK